MSSKDVGRLAWRNGELLVKLRCENGVYRRQKHGQVSWKECINTV